MKSLFLMLVALCTGLPLFASAETMTVLITGANRGLGLELARQYQAEGYRVIGTARTPKKATELKALGAQVEQLDVTDDESIAALAARLEGQALDLLINNAGIFTPRDAFSMEAMEKTTRRDFILSFEVNTLGPHFVTKALLPNLMLSKAELPKVVNISSRMSLLHREYTRGSAYSYTTSKTALNMITKNHAADLKAKNILVVALCPGHNKTDMGTERAPNDPKETMSEARALIQTLTLDDASSLLFYDGQRLDW